MKKWEGSKHVNGQGKNKEVTKNQSVTTCK